LTTNHNRFKFDSTFREDEEMETLTDKELLAKDLSKCTNVKSCEKIWVLAARNNDKPMHVVRRKSNNTKVFMGC
jgi:hypothetical protein